MKIKSVEISNILSIKAMRLEFDDSGLVLLDGWNYDDDTANGAGKTAVLNSISYGIFGKFPRKVSASDILRSGTKAGYVKVSIEVGTSIYEVHRSRPNNLKFYIDGLEKDMTQEEFESHVRMTYQQYLISMYSAQTEGMKLISMNDAGKKDFFLQLLNLEAFSECKDEISRSLSLLYAAETKLKNDISTLETRIETDREYVIDVLAIGKVDNEGIVKLELDIDELKIAEPDTSKIDLLEEKINGECIKLHDLEIDFHAKSAKLSSMRREYEKLEALEFDDSATCPHCNKSFALGDGEKMEKHRLKQLDALSKQMASLSDESTAYPDFSAEKIKYRGMLEKCKSKRASILSSFRDNAQKIVQLQQQKEELEKTARLVTDAVARNHAVNQKISKNTVLLLDAEDKLQSISEQIKLEESVLALFSPTGAPAYVLDSAVDMFNDKVYHYASMIWPNASYTLQSFRENKSGEVKAKFSEKLSINGKDRSIGALSGGEHRCLSLAVDFAVIDVLEAMFGVSINPIMLDEPFNDLDASNRERVLELLEKIATNRQVWVVDHASEAKALFANVVKVEKRSGISSLVI